MWHLVSSYVTPNCLDFMHLRSSHISSSSLKLMPLAVWVASLQYKVRKKVYPEQSPQSCVDFVIQQKLCLSSQKISLHSLVSQKHVPAIASSPGPSSGGGGRGLGTRLLVEQLWTRYNLWTHHGVFRFSQFSVMIAIPGVVLSLLGKYVPTVVLAYVTGEWDLWVACLLVIALFPVYLSVGVLRLRVARRGVKVSCAFPTPVSWEQGMTLMTVFCAWY